MIKQKKIAIVCNYELLPERVGGMDYFYWLFDTKCKENNITIDWFFPNKSSHGNYDNLSIYSSNFTNVENYFLDFCSQNKTQYTHIIAHFIELCTPFFYKIKKHTNAKIIIVDHNPRPLNGYPLKKKMEKIVKGFLFSRYIDVFVGVSEYSKNQLIKDYGTLIKSKATVVFNGLQIDKFIKKINFTSHNKFIVASHLRKEKGIQDLIIAISLLPSEIKKKIKIDIYGEGDYEEKLKGIIQDLLLEEHFNFKGSVSNLNEIYCNYDYLIHPSHGETFCFSVVESLLCNLPVITTKNHGNVLQIVEENKNGFLYEATNANELKEIILKILSGKLERPNILNSNTKVQNFTLENMVKNHLLLLS